MSKNPQFGGRRTLVRATLFLTLVTTITACQCDFKTEVESSSEAEILSFSAKYPFMKEELKNLLKEFSRVPHPFGSQRQQEVFDLLTQEIEKRGYRSLASPFQSEVPNLQVWQNSGAPAPDFISRNGKNLFAFRQLNPEEPNDCIWLVGSHYDTKHVEGIQYLGANDSGSSSIALLFLMEAIQNYTFSSSSCDIGFVWFDGEEPVLPQWHDGQKYRKPTTDNTYGSRFEASRLIKCGDSLCLPPVLGGQRLAGLVLLDMIGSPQVRLSRDINGDSRFYRLLEHLFSQMYPKYPAFTMMSTDIQDDHIPFRNRGVPVIDVIDMNHLTYWHKDGDHWERVDMGSVERISRVVLSKLLILAHSSSISALSPGDN